MRDQVKRLRIHASIVGFLYSSDELPPPSVEKEFLEVFNDERWDNPVRTFGQVPVNLSYFPRVLLYH